MVTKSLSTGLFAKDFSFTYEAQFGWTRNSGLKALFFKDVEYWPPTLIWLIGFLLRDVL